MKEKGTEEKHNTRHMSGKRARLEYEKRAIIAFNKCDRAIQYAINNEIFKKAKEKRDRLALRDKGVI